MKKDNLNCKAEMIAFLKGIMIEFVTFYPQKGDTTIPIFDAARKLITETPEDELAANIEESGLPLEAVTLNILQNCAMFSIKPKSGLKFFKGNDYAYDLYQYVNAVKRQKGFIGNAQYEENQKVADMVTLGIRRSATVAPNSVVTKSSATGVITHKNATSTGLFSSHEMVRCVDKKEKSPKRKLVSIIIAIFGAVFLSIMLFQTRNNSSLLTGAYKLRNDKNQTAAYLLYAGGRFTFYYVGDHEEIDDFRVRYDIFYKDYKAVNSKLTFKIIRDGTSKTFIIENGRIYDLHGSYTLIKLDERPSWMD